MAEPLEKSDPQRAAKLLSDAVQLRYTIRAPAPPCDREALNRLRARLIRNLAAGYQAQH